MTPADPDFGFLFLKVGWQAARKRLLRSPLDPQATATASHWLTQTSASPAFIAFSNGFSPDATGTLLHDFDDYRRETLSELAHQTGAGLKSQVNTMRFYRDYLAVFPELFFKAVPALFFSTKHVDVLRDPPVNSGLPALKQELYFTGPPVAYEIEKDLFFYAVSPAFAKRIATVLPQVLAQEAPHDLGLFSQLAAACAEGTMEMLVIDN
jgi:hypothetical protein